MYGEISFETSFNHRYSAYTCNNYINWYVCICVNDVKLRPPPKLFRITVY